MHGQNDWPRADWWLDGIKRRYLEVHRRHIPADQFKLDKVPPA